MNNFALFARGPENKIRFLTRMGVLMYTLISVFYLFLGQINGDEAWYLYASRLALLGQLPYHDFAYTQMPLSPYIYGVMQIVEPSMYWGRLTSILIALGTLSMSIVIAQRYAGQRAGMLTAWLFSAFVYGTYYNSIVKTYALLAFCFTATWFILSAAHNETVKYPLALIYAFAALLIRVTALFFVVPFVIYTLLTAQRSITRVLILIEGIATGLLATFFLLPDWLAARWGLFDSHLRHWAAAGWSTQIQRVLAERLPDIVQSYGLLLVLLLAALYVRWRRAHSRLGAKQLPMVIYALGLGLFAGSHLGNGLWDTEYLVPAITGLLPLLGILLSEVYDWVEPAARMLGQGIFLAVLCLLLLTESIQHVDFTGRQLPLAEIDTLATFVAQNSQPTDKVLTLEALGVAVNAQRTVLPGLTLGQFSAQLMDTPTAQ